jgi:hypothetical protein
MAKAVDKHNLWHLLRDIIMVSLKATPSEVAFGHPCSNLIDEVVTRGLGVVTDKLIESLPEGTSMRINGAGLKLYIRRDHISVGGDQASEYPDTVDAIKTAIRKAGLEDE